MDGWRRLCFLSSTVPSLVAQGFLFSPYVFTFFSMNTCAYLFVCR